MILPLRHIWILIEKKKSFQMIHTVVFKRQLKRYAIAKNYFQFTPEGNHTLLWQTPPITMTKFHLRHLNFYKPPLSYRLFEVAMINGQSRQLGLEPTSLIIWQWQNRDIIKKWYKRFCCNKKVKDLWKERLLVVMIESPNFHTFTILDT